MLLIRNANIYAPEPLGIKDMLIIDGKIVAIEDHFHPNSLNAKEWDAKGQTVTPGFIDQHIHITGAGGKHSFSSMTPPVSVADLIACGSTTVVGLLGTDGVIRNVRSLYSKAKALNQEGLSAFMYTGYYGIEPKYIMETVQEDMTFIDLVVGCKVAISDIRSSYPTATEMLRLLRDVKVGGMLSGKKGILHIHLGNLSTKMDLLFELVQKYEFPIEHISPTHVGRTKELFEQAIEFGKLGGMIDITTGASKYTDPYKSVLEAMDAGLSIDQMTFSTDGHAGLDRKDEKGELIGIKKAPIQANLQEVVSLIKKGGVPIEEAIKLVTINPAKNVGLKQKGRIAVGLDADFCCFNNSMELTDVIARGKVMMENKEIIYKSLFHEEQTQWV